MLINKHNFAVAKHCSKDAGKFCEDGITRATNAVKLTSRSTAASNGHYLLEVSALQVDGPRKDIYVHPSMLEMFATGETTEIDASMLPQERGEPWDSASLHSTEPPAFEVFMDISYLRKLVEEMEAFSGPDRAVRIQFRKPYEPIRMDIKQPDTKQVMTAFVMGCKPDVHRKAFESV